MNQNHDPKWLLPWVVALMAFAWALRPIWDIDVWWHIALGRSILAHGLPQTDILSAVNPDASWTTFQAGYEIFVAWLDQVGGLFLIRVIHAAAVGAGFGLLTRLALRITSHTWATLAITLVALILFEDRVRVRPHVFNFLFTMILLQRVALRGARWRYRDLVGLVPLMAVWGSLHGPAALWGLALLASVAIARWRDTTTWLTAGVAGIATFSVPGVVSGLVSSLKVHTTAGIQERFVAEHGPLSRYLAEGTLHGWVVVLLVVVSLMLFVHVGLRTWEHREEKPMPKSLLIAGAGMGLFSLLLVRLAWFALVPLLGVMSARRLSPRANLIAAGTLAILFIWDTTSYVHFARYRNVERWSVDVHPGFFPEAAADFLDATGIKGKAFHEVGWGGYLLYRLHPNVTTLFDGRVAFGRDAAAFIQQDDHLKAAYLAAIYRQKTSERERVTAERDFAYGQAFLAHRVRKAFGVDILVRRRPAFGSPRAAPPPKNWDLLFQDDQAEVWVARDEKLTARQKRARTILNAKP